MSDKPSPDRRFIEESFPVKEVGAASSKEKNIRHGHISTLHIWGAAADKLRGHMDESEYKHVVLRLIFLKYISDSFEELHARLLYNVFIGSLVGVSPSMVGGYASHL